VECQECQEEWEECQVEWEEWVEFQECLEEWVEWEVNNKIKIRLLLILILLNKNQKLLLHLQNLWKKKNHLMKEKNGKLKEMLHINKKTLKKLYLVMIKLLNQILKK
jgi:hypothetical protein